MHDLITNKKATINLIGHTRIVSTRVFIIQILRNLISNSLKYTREDIVPEININTIYNDLNESYTIDFSDNGIGIPKNEIKDVFTPLKRLSNKGKIEGTGLGASIIKRSIDKMNGKISVSSELGVGTVFSIQLPKDKPTKI